MNSLKTPEPQISNSKFRLGIIFLVLSYVFGWPFLLLIETIALYYQSSTLGIIGAIIYIVSWGLLGIAVLLAGPDVVVFVKQKNINWRDKKPRKTPE